jgi:hypothetical protein
MPKAAIGFDTVRRLGRGLPGVEEGTTYGTPALKVGGKMFACLANHKSAEPNTLALRLDFDERDRLIEADPATYYLKPHYVNYPVVLVRMNQVSRDALQDLLRAAWRFTSAKAKRPPRARQPRRPL